MGQTITSGGGFSNYYPQLTWQSSAVSGYFSAVAAINQKPVSGYRASGRAYPDISLAGINYVVVIGGISYDVSGTSASCPAVAGFFSNINAARIKLGKGSLGWLNPTLYTKGSSFINDITSGDNYCVADGTCCSTGFYATKGWDPATGLGSVNYGKMATLFVSLGQIVFVAEPSSSEASSGIYCNIRNTRSCNSDSKMTRSLSHNVHVVFLRSFRHLIGGTNTYIESIVVGTVISFFVILTIVLSVIFCPKCSSEPPEPPPYPYVVEARAVVVRDGIPDPTLGQAPSP